MNPSVKPPAASKTQWHLPLLGLLAFFLFFYKLGSYPLFDVDEPRYAEAAREMIERGNWITPYFNYELRFDKPIFFYWLVAIAYKMFGVSEFSARLWSAIMATATVAGVYCFGKKLVSPRLGLFSALILATSIEFIGLARMSVTDMTLAAFMTATTLCLFLAAAKDVRWWLAAGVFSGLAILTKGPVGLVVPGAILVLYALMARDFKRCFLTPYFPVAIGIALAIAFPWYYLAWQENGQIFLDMLVFHNVNRFSDTVSGHDQPVWFFFAVLLVGFLPWSVYLPAAIKHGWQKIRQFLKTGEGGMEARLLLFSVIWVVFILLFFTASGTKLLTYVLPFFPGLALWMGLTWLRVAEDPAGPLTPWMRNASWLLLVTLATGGTIALLNVSALLPREARGTHLEPAATVTALLVLMAGPALAAWFLKPGQKETPKPLNPVTSAVLLQAVNFGLVCLIALNWIVPPISQAAQGVMLGYLNKTGNAPLMIFEIQRPSLTFYGKRRIPRLTEDDKSELQQLLTTTPRWYVITKSKHLEKLGRTAPPNARIEVLEKGPVYSLLTLSVRPNME